MVEVRPERRNGVAPTFHPEASTEDMAGSESGIVFVLVEETARRWYRLTYRRVGEGKREELLHSPAELVKYFAELFAAR